MTYIIFNKKSQVTEVRIMSIGRNLTLIMYDKKIKQKDIADHLGVTQQTISKFINGEKIPSVVRLMQIAECLGVTLDDLVK